MFQLFFGTSFQKTALQDYLYGIYICLVSQVFIVVVRAVQGQLSKFTRRNTVISFRKLVTSHKGLKGREVFSLEES